MLPFPVVFVGALLLLGAFNYFTEKRSITRLTNFLENSQDQLTVELLRPNAGYGTGYEFSIVKFSNGRTFDFMDFGGYLARDIIGKYSNCRITRESIE